MIKVIPSYEVNIMKQFKTIILIIILQSLSGCSVLPKNLDGQNSDQSNHFTRSVNDNMRNKHLYEELIRSGLIETRNDEIFVQKFSAGDTVKIKFHSLPDYNGLYKVNSQGHLEMPFADGVNVNLLSRKEVIKKLQLKLKQIKWVQSINTPVDISLVEAASINVSVFGAVFNQGQVLINAKPVLKPESNFQHLSGTFSEERNLVSAIQAAGGMRPDANLKKVIIKRGNKHFSFDLTSMVLGDFSTTTPSLINGDLVFVESTGSEDKRLIRPSQVTPPGMRVLISNLTAPALSNALSAAGADATRLPYGSSLIDAAISANCIGGTHYANASRSVLFVTRNHGSKQQIVIKRTINELLANSSNFLINPYLMPDDGIACYDSKFTNIRDVARGIGELFGPILLGGLL